MRRVAMKEYPFGDQLLIKEVQEEFVTLIDAVVCEKLCEIVEKEFDNHSPVLSRKRLRN